MSFDYHLELDDLLVPPGFDLWSSTTGNTVCFREINFWAGG